jgi:hypothetical protein
LQSGYGTDLYEQTSRSYGNIFEVRTKSKGETVLVTGFEIYTSSIERVTYQVWTKEGPWRGFEGQRGKFTKIAQGQVKGKGECDETRAENCQFTLIPFEEFKSVPITGDGGSRSFYVTLNTRDIVYSRGSSTDIDTFNIQQDNQDIEIYEGGSVLMFPFTEATDPILHYRTPRGFLGRIYYERNPCEDGSFEWPCQTRAPNFVSTSKPTQTPTPKPTQRVSCLLLLLDVMLIMCQALTLHLLIS